MNRKRPRHVHQGQDEEEEQRVETAVVAQPPSARLYRHALESIFAFLSLNELRAVLAVSRLWSSAVSSMASVGAAIEFLPVGRSLLRLSVSRLARHIGTLGSERNPIALSQESLYLTGFRLTALRSLFYKLPLPLLDDPLIFPSSLTRLEVRVPDGTIPRDINLTIAATAQLPLLNVFQLECRLAPAVSFAPLHLSSLQELRLPRWFQTISQTQADDLRAIPQLTFLDHWFDLPKMRPLLRAPLELKWRKLKVTGQLDDEVIGLLASLPSLTEISTNNCSDVSFLRSLPQLHALTLSRSSSLTRVQEIGACKQLTQLTIFAGSLTAAHTAALLSHMPMLRKLELDNMTKLESLHFLSSTESLQRLLTNLTLVDCRHPSLLAEELRHVFTLQQLTHLSVRRCFAEELDSLLLHELTPPSLCLPKLLHSEVVEV